MVLNPLKTLTVSLVDMTLVRRRTAGVYWPFLVPWIPNGFMEWRSFPGVPKGRSVNTQVSAAVEWRPGPRFFLEFLGDDYRWHSWQDPNPNRLAVSAGVDHEWDRWRGGYEFRRVESWTYTHFDPSTALRQFRWPLGAPEGPDGDRHIFWGVAGAGDWTLHLTGERRRRGENRLGDVWDGEGRRGEGFPWGRVETRWILEAGIRRRVSGWGTAHLSAFYQDIENLNNQPGRRSLLGLQAGFHLLSPALTVNWLPSSARHGS